MKEIAHFQLPIADWFGFQSAIGNGQLAIVET
jgi:hypothetical protein